jgi:hypothetical protein
LYATHTHTHTHTHLCLDVERDQAVGDQVMDGLEPLLGDKVLPIVVQTEVFGLVPEARIRGVQVDVNDQIITIIIYVFLFYISVLLWKSVFTENTCLNTVHHNIH